MALPPSVPTSFVPHTASAGARKFRADYTGAFAFLGYGVLLIALVLSVTVFFYGRILSGVQAGKDAELQRAEASIDSATVESFVRLRDRLTKGRTLLDNHRVFTSFFSVMQTIIPTTVRFSSLHLLDSSSGMVRLEGAGVAKSFNALAAASNAFASDGRIKDAIFSDIDVSPKDGSVSFVFVASLDPKLVNYSIANVTPTPAPVTTSSATSSVSTTGSTSSPQATP